MATIKVEADVSKEAYELMQGVIEFIKGAKPHLSDGIDVEDIAPLMAEAMTHLVGAIDGWEKLGEEAKGDLPAFLKAVSLSSADLYDALKG